jgi:ATP synthase protein I
MAAARGTGARLSFDGSGVVMSVSGREEEKKLAEKKQLKLATRVSAVGLEMVLAVLVGYFGGRWLDGHFGTGPYLTYTGFVLGLIAAFKSLWTIARRIDLDRL